MSQLVFDTLLHYILGRSFKTFACVLYPSINWLVNLCQRRQNYLAAIVTTGCHFNFSKKRLAVYDVTKWAKRVPTRTFHRKKALHFHERVFRPKFTLCQIFANNFLPWKALALLHDRGICYSAVVTRSL